MPTASNRERALMKKWFDDPINDGGPMNFLHAHGYTKDRGIWHKPTPSHTVTIYELHCLWFLCDEWDYAYDFSDQSNFTRPIPCIRS